MRSFFFRWFLRRFIFIEFLRSPLPISIHLLDVSSTLGLSSPLGQICDLVWARFFNFARIISNISFCCLVAKNQATKKIGNGTSKENRKQSSHFSGPGTLDTPLFRAVFPAPTRPAQRNPISPSR